MDREDIYLSLDRLTRFKNPEIKYRRVFYDIILKHLVQPSLSVKHYPTTFQFLLHHQGEQKLTIGLIYGEQKAKPE